MTPEQLIERVKSLGPEWNRAANLLTDAMRHQVFIAAMQPARVVEAPR